MLSLSCHYNTTSVTPRSAAHFLKCFLTLSLCLNSLSHKPQENCLHSECTGWYDNVSNQLLYRNASCRWTCILTVAEFLLIKVTQEPSTFIVWLQQMCDESTTPCNTCLNSVYVSMTLHQCEYENDASVQCQFLTKSNVPQSRKSSVHR